MLLNEEHTKEWQLKESMDRLMISFNVLGIFFLQYYQRRKTVFIAFADKNGKGVLPWVVSTVFQKAVAVFFIRISKVFFKVIIQPQCKNLVFFTKRVPQPPLISYEEGK